ncbi:hypothetical protein BOTBODRAFT_37938 [Botryobasidium botryosum FD-172 SS1]|uniref:Uncharacterized protein n=1 Tax=Botryobasidium botryosum (strain FD-172 SS1) TaxID=930990 RepID=A0A067LZ13_BOTB1|nr:hypothetical protein BOTBODRAFT_37938 [Botryobasidium botryosum FD-172 SS1]
MTDDFESSIVSPGLGDSDQARLENELERVGVMYQYLSQVLMQRLELYTSMRAPSMELLRHAIYYSAHS